MSAFSAFDGTKLAYDELGMAGDPVVCLPGGPMQASVYLGDLGGLSEERRLIRLDLRGTGDSAVPEDVESYRCDRLVDDVEALRRHLALDLMDLLAHSAGANLALLYAVRHPDRVRRLTLVAPSLMAAGISVSVTDRREVADLRTGEEWFPEASAALARVAAEGGSVRDWERLAPFFYGRWDAAARAHKALEAGGRNHEAAAIFGSEGAFDARAVREALADFRSPTLILAGELDLNTPPSRAAELAEIFPNVELVVQPGSAHFPWLDDADRFVATTSAFLAGDPRPERD